MSPGDVITVFTVFQTLPSSDFSKMYVASAVASKETVTVRVMDSSGSSGSAMEAVARSAITLTALVLNGLALSALARSGLLREALVLPTRVPEARL